MTYIIEAKLSVEVEAESKEKAQEQAAKKFEEIEKVGAKISDARVIDKQTGYFIG